LSVIRGGVAVSCGILITKKIIEKD
jgi:hypothetical protein